MVSNEGLRRDILHKNVCKKTSTQEKLLRGARSLKEVAVFLFCLSPQTTDRCMALINKPGEWNSYSTLIKSCGERSDLNLRRLVCTQQALLLTEIGNAVSNGVATSKLHCLTLRINNYFVEQPCETVRVMTLTILNLCTTQCPQKHVLVQQLSP